MNNLGQIIAIGGGGFGRTIYNNKIDNYIISQCNKEKPKVCFIPTASAEDKSYTVNFFLFIQSPDYPISFISSLTVVSSLGISQTFSPLAIPTILSAISCTWYKLWLIKIQINLLVYK